MKALAMKPPELARLEAAFCLDKLSARVQSDVLADGRLAARFLFEVKHPVRLADDLAFPRQELFVAFRSAADKGEFTLQAKSGAVGQVAISDDHVATVDFGGRRWRFMYVALLASEIDRRKQVLESLLARHTLSVGAQQHLLSIVRKDNLSDEEFLEMVALLDTSPENFAHGLSSHANEEKISRTDLLPRDDRYWDNLAPAPLSSGDLVHYLANELGEVRRIRFAAEPHRALDFASLGCAATFLAPLEATRKIESDILCSMIERATKHDDHFALLTLFEICVDSVGRDVSFEDLGE